MAVLLYNIMVNPTVLAHFCVHFHGYACDLTGCACDNHEMSHLDSRRARLSGH